MEFWEILPEFTDTAKAYQDFIDAVYKLYPGSDLEWRWVIADLDKLVGETLQVGILSLTDLGKYHRDFMAITTFLITKNHILPAEQSCAFTWGFSLELWNRVAHCLQLKLPDHCPDNPYTLKKIHDAACFVFHGTTLYTFVYDDQRQSTQTTAAVVKVEPTIKTEDFTALLDVMKQSLRLVTKVIRVSLHLFAISIATFVEAVILKIAVMFSRSISVTVSVYFTMMGALPFQADVSF